MMQARILPFLALPLLAACAAPTGEYPSLAIRDGERVSGAFEPPAADAYVPDSPASATIDQFDSLLQTVRTAHGRFTDAAATARRSVTAARGSRVGSPAWSDAEVAIATLQSRRAEAQVALADMDRIYVETATAGEAVATLDPARDEALQLVAEQDALIASLRASLYS